VKALTVLLLAAVWCHLHQILQDCWCKTAVAELTNIHMGSW
jgi:hypothetical protein